jgi:hypothetical protein
MQKTNVVNECMNRKNEEILRILAQESQKTELGVKSMAWEDLKGKTVFLEGSRGICRFFEWLEALARKSIALAKFGKNLGIFGDFLWIFGVLEGLRTYS